MGKREKDSATTYQDRPAITPEGRDDQMINMAYNLAEERMHNGTASNSMILHFLKLGATREKDRLEKEILAEQKELYHAKTEQIKSLERTDKVYADAIAAMRRYSGLGSEVIEDDEY